MKNNPKQVNLNKNSWHCKVYEALYFNAPSDNFCDYFWKLMFALVTLPFWCVGSKLICFTVRDKFYNSFFIFLVTIVVWGAGFSALSSSGVSDFFILWLAPIPLLFLIAAFIVFVFYVVFKVFFLTSKLGRATFKKKKGSGDDIFVEKFKAFKGKYCPKINWTKQPKRVNF